CVATRDAKAMTSDRPGRSPSAADRREGRLRHMKMNHKCARAVAAILGTQAGAAAYAAAPDQSRETVPAPVGIQEVVVTAQRRAENAQDVPIAIQAFTGETLKELKVTSFDDLIR